MGGMIMMVVVMMGVGGILIEMVVGVVFRYTLETECMDTCDGVGAMIPLVVTQTSFNTTGKPSIYLPIQIR